MLAACLGLPFLARSSLAGPPPFPDGAQLLIAGPQGGRLDRFAGDLLPALARGLPAGTDLRPVREGGRDGVTGANQFEARGVPDGTSLLLMPGEAALAWLIGDPRARFDPGTLVPLLAGVAPGVLMSRYPVEGAKHLRIAAGRPDGPDLAGLLALELLGLRPEPAFGFPDAATVEQLILANGADATFIVGADAPARVERLTRAGLAPVFTLGVPGEDHAVLREPLMPDVPTLPELVTQLRGIPPAGALYDAWRAVSVSAQLSFLLALPALTPAGLVSLWRRSAADAAPALGPTGPMSGRILACPDANQFTAPLAGADPGTLIELRRWLAVRLGWQPA